DALSGAKRPAVICDCEGAEIRLLDPDRIDSLRRALILVETHDGLQTREGVLEGITTGLQKRFAHTHDSEVIASRARQRQDLPGEYAGLDDTDADEVMNEGRPWAQWLFLRPNPPNRDETDEHCTDRLTSACGHPGTPRSPYTLSVASGGGRGGPPH